MMPDITLRMTQLELKEALREWVERKGFLTSDKFSIDVKTYPGDRPFENGYTVVEVSGVHQRSASV